MTMTFAVIYVSFY